MTVTDLTAQIQAVCPIQGVDSTGGIVFDPSATQQQIVAAQTLMASNLSKLDGVVTLPSNIQTAISRFTFFKGQTPAAQNSMTPAQIGPLINSIIDCLNYLNQQIKNS